MTIADQEDTADPFAAELMDSYLEGRKEDVRLLGQALDQRNYDLVRMIGHNLFGSGGAYGLPALSDIGERLENAADAKDSGAISAAIHDLKEIVSP